MDDKDFKQLDLTLLVQKPADIYEFLNSFYASRGLCPNHQDVIKSINLVHRRNGIQ